jgi:hypothetical protein
MRSGSGDEVPAGKTSQQAPGGDATALPNTHLHVLELGAWQPPLRIQQGIQPQAESICFVFKQDSEQALTRLVLFTLLRGQSKPCIPALVSSSLICFSVVRGVNVRAPGRRANATSWKLVTVASRPMTSEVTEPSSSSMACRSARSWIRLLPKVNLQIE